MKISKDIKNLLSEALGVPDNLVNLASAFYSALVDRIPNNGTFDNLQNEVFEFGGKFNIADYKFKGVKFILELHENDDIDILGLSTKNLSRVTKKFKIKTKVNHGVLDISMVFAVPKNVKGKDLKKFLIDNKVEIVGSISHELKHYYDNFIKPKGSIKDRAKYESLTRNRFASITPLNLFLHHSYFVHRIENLVRASEFAGALEAGEVTKEGFLEFLRSHSVYQKLKEIQNFTYEGLRQSLLEDMPEIKDVFNHNGIDYDGLTDDEIVDRTLEIFLGTLQEWEVGAVESRLTDNVLENLLGFKGKKRKFFIKYLNSMKPYGKNFKQYFENEEKKFKFVATNMIKKIAKLYDMAKDVKNESIINWELWHKLKGTNSKIVTESKYFKKK